MVEVLVGPVRVTVTVGRKGLCGGGDELCGYD